MTIGPAHDIAPPDGMRTRPELRAMLTVSRAVAQGGPLADVLDRIAAEAAGVVLGADRSSIILIEGSEHRFRLAGSFGLSEAYRLLLSTGEAKLLPGEGPSGVAFQTGAPVAIDDLDADPRVASWAWRDIAREECYRAIVSLPLLAGGSIVGTLNIYRTEAGPWTAEEIDLLAFFAEHAAGAVQTAQLLDQRNQQLAALRRVVRMLREQTHEHANRLHAVGGLLALDEVDEAKEFLHVLESSHVQIREALDARIQVPTVAGLVLAVAIVAGQRGIRLTLAPDSSLRALPPALTETQVVTILGNLLDNAFDAVANLAPERREVILHIDDRGGALLIEVTDFGAGLPDAVPELFDRGVSFKRGHAGIGLSLVAAAARAAMGAVQAIPEDDRTTFRVSIPG
ncbi:MAG: GAF domain-containing protein [Solirubrobacteraceae bacterium]